MTNYTSHCVICHKVITWQFNLCEKHLLEYGKTAEERPEWVNFLIREEQKIKDRISKPRIKNGNEEYIEDIANYETGFSYIMYIEDLVETKMDFAGYITVTSDGEAGYEFQDSDWEAVYSYGI